MSWRVAFANSVTEICTVCLFQHTYYADFSTTVCIWFAEDLANIWHGLDGQQAKRFISPLWCASRTVLCLAVCVDKWLTFGHQCAFANQRNARVVVLQWSSHRSDYYKICISAVQKIWVWHCCTVLEVLQWFAKCHNDWMLVSACLISYSLFSKLLFQLSVLCRLSCGKRLYTFSDICVCLIWLQPSTLSVMICWCWFSSCSYGCMQ